MTHLPIGILTSDATGHALAARLATPSQRVLLYKTKSEPARTPPYAKHAFIDLVSTPADIAIECEIILTTLEDTAQLREILLGSGTRGPLGPDLKSGATLVDFGVRPPRECQSLLGILGARGVSLVDAAIVGTAQALQSGTATVLTGGFPDAVDAVLPVLSRIGRVERTGPLGSAHTAAALMGYMEAAHTIARDEAYGIGRALGLNAETLERLIEPETTASNIVAFTRRASLASELAAERGLSAEVIDLTLRKLHQAPPKSG